MKMKLTLLLPLLLLLLAASGGVLHAQATGSSARPEEFDARLMSALRAIETHAPNAAELTQVLENDYSTYPLAFLPRLVAAGTGKDWPAMRAAADHELDLGLEPAWQGVTAAMLSTSPRLPDQQLAARMARACWRDTGSRRGERMAALAVLTKLDASSDLPRDLAAGPAPLQQWNQTLVYLATILDGASSYARSLVPLPAATLPSFQPFVRGLQQVPELRDTGLALEALEAEKHGDEAAAAKVLATAKVSEVSPLLEAAQSRWNAWQAASWLLEGRPEPALHLLGASFPSVPEPAEISVIRARALAASGRYADAMTGLQSVALMGASPAYGVEFLPISTDLHAADLVYWQGRLAYEHGDYATCIAALADSQLVKQGVDFGAQAALASCQEKLGQRSAALANWRKLKDAAGYTMYEEVAAAGLRRLGEPAKVNTPMRSVQGYLAQVQCRAGRPTAIVLQNGTLQFGLEVPSSSPLARRLPACGVQSAPRWSNASFAPLVTPGAFDAARLTDISISPKPAHVDGTLQYPVLLRGHRDVHLQVRKQ